MLDHDPVKLLFDLLRTSQNRKQGFADAAEEATRPELKSFFNRRSIDCGTAVVELQSLVESVGGAPMNPEAAGSLGWPKLKTAFGDANMVTLEEVELAEGQARSIYRDALSVSLPVQIRSVVQGYYDGTVRNHELVRQLRDSYIPTRLPW